MSGFAVVAMRGRIASKRETTESRTRVQTTVEHSAFRSAHAIVAKFVSELGERLFWIP